MNLLDKIKGKFTAKTFVDPDAAYFPNRHDRRAMGIKGPVGLVPDGLEGFVQEPYDVRYIERHWEQAASPRRTRRRQKARARIQRIITRSRP
jgi:hypothetical protein